MIKERSLIGLAVIAVLAACGGGGGGGSTTPSTQTQQQVPTGDAPASFSITVPAGSGSSSVSRRSPKYVAPGTQSLTLTLLQTNGTPVTSTPLGPFNLVAGSTGCSAVNVTPLTCTFSINAPIGTDVYIANTFSGTNAVGPLGSGAVALSVALNSSNNANLVLSGPIQSISAFSNNTQFSDTLWNGIGGYDAYICNNPYSSYCEESSSRRPEGIPSSAPSSNPTPPTSERVYFIASDASGNVILNPTTYNQPIIVTLNYCCNATQNILLSDVPPSGFGSASSTSASGGTVDVYSPADVVTVSLIPTIASPLIYGYEYASFAYLTATLASPPPNFNPPPYFAVTAEVVPTPSPTPLPSSSPSPPPPTPSPSPTGFITVIGS